MISEKDTAPVRETERGLDNSQEPRHKNNNPKCPSSDIYLRNGEREPSLATPPEHGVVVVRVQPRTIIIATHAQKVRALVHHDNPPKTHLLDLLIRELLADKAGDLHVDLSETSPNRFGSDIPGESLSIREQLTPQNSNLNVLARRWNEVGRSKHSLRFTAQPLSLTSQNANPFFSTSSVGDDIEANEIALHPELGSVLENPLTRTDSQNYLSGGPDTHLPSKLFEYRVLLTSRYICREIALLLRHLCFLLRSVAHSNFPLIRGGSCGLYGHSQKIPKRISIFWL